MLKIIRSSDLAQRDNNNEIVESGSDKNLSKSKKSKNVKAQIQIYIKATGKSTFLTPGARKPFN